MPITKPALNPTGTLAFPKKWTVFAPIDDAAPILEGRDLLSIPPLLRVGGLDYQPVQVEATNNQFNFAPFFGPVSENPTAAYVFVELHSDAAQEVTLGLGADYYMKVWLNGAEVIDRLTEGNLSSPPSIADFPVQANLSAGKNVLAVLFLNGRTHAILALGGPEELRGDLPPSIAPPKPKVVDAKSLYEIFPPDPEAVVSWTVPEGFDPTLPDLGMEHLDEAEHTEIFQAIPNLTAIEDGGTGVYTDLRHATWNHGPRLVRFGDFLVASWNSHARDEGGPGSRPLGKYGRILDGEGRVDWGGDETLFEAAPAAVPVRRRREEGDREILRCIQTRGGFRVIDGRLLFVGNLLLLHGKSTDPSQYWRGGIPVGRTIAHDHFHHGAGAKSLGGQNLRWLIGVNYAQEWGCVDGKLCPISPLYRQGEPPAEIALTPKLTAKVETLTPAFLNAVPVDAAPPELKAFLPRTMAQPFENGLNYSPDTSHLTVDGKNGLAHAAEYQRPDGTWVAVRENQRPPTPVYYVAEKPDAESVYPPARCSNLYGAVNPCAGRLPDGTVFLIGNSPNRCSMFLTLSRDGRHFDRTWFLLHRQLSDFTPGVMKREGGAGGGPQYFHATIVGESLWIIYSISKEHIGTTRIPLSALQATAEP